MKTIKEVIDESTALGEKLIAENPGLTNLTFEFSDFALDEVEEYAKANNEEVKFKPREKRFGFVALGNCIPLICIHIRSVEVKARLVYDEVAELSKI